MPNHSTPSALRVVQGQPTPQDEPQAQRGAPPIPSFLSKRAKKVWKETAPILLQLGTLTTADGDALTAYCETVVMCRLAQESIDKDGITVMTPAGLKRNPSVAVYDSALKQQRALMGEFGLTPASRTRIKSNNPELESPLTKLLGERSRLRTNTVTIQRVITDGNNDPV